MRRLSSDLLEAERKRAATRAEQRPAARGDVWVTETSITNGSGRILEHSRVPIEVVVVADHTDVLEVVPVSYDVDFAGEFDVQLPESVLSRAAMVEVWLRMAVARRVLARRLGAVSSETLGAIDAASDRLVERGGEPLPVDDPRLWFYGDERMRVAFALAATGEEIELPPGPAVEDDPALRLKRGEPARWRIAPAPPEVVSPGYERAPEPAGVSPSRR